MVGGGCVKGGQVAGAASGFQLPLPTVSLEFLQQFDVLAFNLDSLGLECLVGSESPRNQARAGDQGMRCNRVAGHRVLSLYPATRALRARWSQEGRYQDSGDL